MLSDRIQQRNIWLWALYDAANSLAFAGLSVFFGVWFISEYGASDGWMSLSMVMTTVILLLTLPVLGRYSDRIGRRLPFLIIATLIGGSSLIILGIVASYATTRSIGTTLLIFLLYSVFMLCYMGSLAFYDGLMRGLSAGRTLEGLSSLGMAVGQIGWIVGLLLAYPVANGTIGFFGLHGKPGAFALGGTAFLICSLPTLLFFREERVSETTMSMALSVKESIRDIKELRHMSGPLPFLIAYALFADAILTLELFAVVYMNITGGLPENLQTGAFLAAIVAGVIGSALAPLFARIFRSTHRTIVVFLGAWMLTLVTLAMAASTLTFICCLIIGVFSAGVLFALCRSFFAALVPEDRQAEMFGLYAVFEKTASMIGPTLWSLMAFIFISFGPDKYRFSVLSLAFLIGISLFLLKYVPDIRKQHGLSDRVKSTAP